MKTKIYIIFIIGLLISNNLQAQFIQFSQFYSSPMILAPSFTGMTENSRLVGNYRDQWPSISGTFVTFAASYDQHSEKINSGFGVLAVRDQAGSGNLARTDVGVLYSWYTKLGPRRSQIYFRPGIHLKMTQRSIDFYNLIFADQLQGNADPSNLPPTIENPPEVRKFYLDAATSAMIYGPQFWGGVSADHLFRPNESLTFGDAKVATKFSVFGGYKFYIGHANRRRQYDKDSRESITATAYYRYQGGYDQFDIGAYWHTDPFTLGMWLRGMPIINDYNQIERNINLDALVFLVGYRIFNFRVGYSYDLTISEMLGATGGAHEISLSYEFQSRLRKKPRHTVSPCPKL